MIHYLLWSYFRVHRISDVRKCREEQLKNNEFLFLFFSWANKTWCSPSNPSHVHTDMDRGSGEQTSHNTVKASTFLFLFFFSLLLRKCDILRFIKFQCCTCFTYTAPTWCLQSQQFQKLPRDHQHFIKIATGGSTKIRKLLIWIWVSLWGCWTHVSISLRRGKVKMADHFCSRVMEVGCVSNWKRE